MNIAAFLFSAAVIVYTPVNPTYTKPVNLGETKIKTTKPINLVDSFQEKKFVKVDHNEISYQDLRLHAANNCKHNKKPSMKIIDILIEVEKSFGPPPEMRGMILAAACMESGFRPSALGDRKFSKSKKTPMAVGILQLWPIYEKMFPGLNRKDPLAAAQGWMSHIARMIPKVKRQCRYKKDKKIWLAAWVTGIRYKKANGRCKERPTHYRLLKKWHRQIKKEKIDSLGCVEGDGCDC